MIHFNNSNDFFFICFTVAIYGGNYITPQNGVAAGILIVLGLYLMIFGFRSFRLTLAVCGYITFGKKRKEKKRKDIVYYLILLFFPFERFNHLGSHGKQSALLRLYQ